MTGQYATDVSDASGMQFLDVRHRCWSDEILDLLDIDPAWLAKVYESPDVTGTLTPAFAAETGLLPQTIVVGGAGDNAAAAVGTGIVSDGKAFTTIGTSGVVFAHRSCAGGHNLSEAEYGGTGDSVPLHGCAPREASTP